MRKRTAVFTAILNMVFPSIIFYIVYKLWGIIPAVAVSAAFCVGNILVSAIRKRVKNTQILGLLGLLASAVAIYFTGQEKYYYIPSLIENVFFLGFMVCLCCRHKSVLHYIAKDFEIASLQKIPEHRMMNVNTLWLVFFSLKIIAKIVGIVFLNFNTLYWLVFIMGDPMTIVTIILSIVLIRRSWAVEEDDITPTDENSDLSV